MWTDTDADSIGGNYIAGRSAAQTGFGMCGWIDWSLVKI